MKGVALCILTVFALGGCGLMPRDTEGTLERVKQRQEIRMGAGRTGGPYARAVEAAVRRVEAETSARANVTAGSLEPLLVRLEQGDLDLVAGEFAEDTPWATRVALSPPLARRKIGDKALEMRLAMRNGENRWIMLVEKTVRKVAPKAATS